MAVAIGGGTEGPHGPRPGVLKWRTAVRIRVFGSYLNPKDGRTSSASQRSILYTEVFYPELLLFWPYF